MISCATERDVVSEESIRRLVDAFYAKVRIDSELGPVFARAIPGDWQPHLNKMYAFWSSVMLNSGRYRGNPVARHLAVEGITMELFDDRLRDEFGAKAARIAESLKLALFYRPDRPWPPQPQA